MYVNQKKLNNAVKKFTGNEKLTSIVLHPERQDPETKAYYQSISAVDETGIIFVCFLHDIKEV